MAMEIQFNNWDDLSRIKEFEAVQSCLRQITGLLTPMGGKIKTDAAVNKWYLSDNGSLQTDVTIEFQFSKFLEYYEFRGQAENNHG